MQRDLLVPPLESFSAVCQKLVITGEVTSEMFLSRFIIFAPIVIVLPADSWALVINGATATVADELTTVIYYQKPAIFILINLYIPMGNLPEQGLKVIFAAWSINLLSKVTATFGSTAEATFVFCGDFCHHYLEYCPGRMVNNIVGLQEYQTRGVDG